MKFISGSSSFGRQGTHLMFKVKYCHNIFDDAAVKKRCGEILCTAMQEYKMQIYALGFGRNHVHIEANITHKFAVWQVAKTLKGRSAKFLLREFPYLKKKYFWGSGLWNPSYFYDGVGYNNLISVQRYVSNQELERDKNQATLSQFFSS